MSLRYALLAVLTARPMTGYDLARTFHASVGHVWNAPNSQIYPELHRMENDGLIAGEDVPWGSRGDQAAVFDHGCRNRSLPCLDDPAPRLRPRT